MFEKFAETINNAGKAVGEKTKLGTDVVKANFKISSEERAINELYLEEILKLAFTTILTIPAVIP